jgi:hypothetical protein
MDTLLDVLLSERFLTKTYIKIRSTRSAFLPIARSVSLAEQRRDRFYTALHTTYTVAAFSDRKVKEADRKHSDLGAKAEINV